MLLQARPRLVTATDAAGLAAILVAYNTVLNLVTLPVGVHPAANLAVTVMLLAWARGRGFGWDALGFAREIARVGLLWGVVVVGAIALVLAVAATLGSDLPVIRELLSDRRATRLGNGDLLYHGLVRIPVGTALLEEVAFRGVLFAALLTLGSRGFATVWSSVAFGLWHIGPAVEALRINQVDFAMGEWVLAVGGAVLLTAIGGVLFCLLRIWTAGLVAPLVVHWGNNALALATAAQTPP